MIVSRTRAACLVWLVLAALPAASAHAAGAYDEDLVIMLQSGLHRVGCLSSEPDGNWGARSKAALGEFARRVGQTLVGLEPSRQALALLDQYDDVVCRAGQPVTVDDPEDEAGVGGDDILADDDETAVVVTKHKTKQEPEPAPEPEPVVEARTCVLATVTVGPKPNYGAQWDFPGKAPDIRFTELTTGASSFCNNSYSCQLRISSGAGSLSFDIVDDDGVNADDQIGSGQCTVAAQCNLPPAASISMLDCS